MNAFYFKPPFGAPNEREEIQSIPNHPQREASSVRYTVIRILSPGTIGQDAPGCSILGLAELSFNPQRERACTSPRFPCFAEWRADLMKVLQNFPVGPEHAGLVVSDCVNATEVFDDRLRFSQLVPG